MSSLVITTLQIKELRDATGISVMQCRNALSEAEGDMEKAVAILKKTSSDVALKKGGREVKDGAVKIKIEGKKAVLVSLHCETDFVSRNEDFVNLLAELTEDAYSMGAEKMKGKTKDMINLIIQKTGENIEIGDVYEVEGNILGGYVHNNKTAVIVSLEGGNGDLAKDIAMHIVAMQPEDTKTLLDQPFIKDGDLTVGKLLEKSGAKIKEVKRDSI